MDPLLGVFNGISLVLGHPALRWVVSAAYLGVLMLVSIYGLHRYWLVWLYYRHKKFLARPDRLSKPWPKVTVQLPMYNEPRVARRVIDAACALDYPKDRLQIQVLDDSTDQCAQIARHRVGYWRRRGVDIEVHHRAHRQGYKAGALADGLRTAQGELIAIFDADFVPKPNFLKRTIRYFADPSVGMVQTCWDHLNREDSLLTRSQAIFLDGHFLIEHTARNRSGRWINFNGTGGVWRREAIESAGGWQHDTLTEDVDLSYRAQLAGWKFVFLPRVACPAELPPEINAFKAQQHRWTKGSIQTARKLLPTLLRASVPLRVKVEAFFHLTSPMVYLYICLMTLLFYPAMHANISALESGTWSAAVIGLSLFGLGTASAGMFYTVSQRERRRGVWAMIAQLPVMMAIGIGICVNNTRGCVEALLGHQSGFERTPKYNKNDQIRSKKDKNRQIFVLPTPSIKVWMPAVEVGMGVYCLCCAWMSCVVQGTVVSLPFLLLFAAGYLYVGATSLRSQWQVRRAALPVAVQPAA